jgi:cytochrome c oxidase cbb3-type subunit III
VVGKFLKAFAVCLVVTTLLAGQERKVETAAKKNPLAGQPKAIEAGQTMFRQTCTVCHGPFGEGGQGEGQGPNLIAGGAIRRASDGELASIIHNGVPGSAMPGFKIPEQQTWELVSYLRTLGATAITLNLPGNVEAGRAIFFGKGQCSTCHMVAGQGGFLGPDLSDVGAIRRLDQLRDAVLKNTAGSNTSGDLYSDPYAGYRAVLLTTDGGQMIEAVAKHYSNYSMQVLDKNGKLYLLRGAEMKRAAFREKSWMPDDYSKRLSADELQDLLAYLSRRSVRKPGEPKRIPPPEPEE